MKKICLSIFIFVSVFTFSATAQWSENFDAYTPGALPPQSSWIGWENAPGAADFNVVTDQAQSMPHSVAIDGPDDAVHEYSGYTTGQWEYSTWQYFPSSAAGAESYFILLNTYDNSGGGDHNWSLQVEFWPALEKVIITDTQESVDLIKDQWVEVSVYIDLDADTQTVFYGGTQVGVTRSWTEGSTGGGALNIGAVDLWANDTTYAVYYDDFNLETYVPTPTPTGAATETPTPAPTYTPTPVPTATPGCTTLGAEIEMPLDFYTPGDTCYVTVFVCNPETTTYNDVPLFVILDVYGTYFFAPDFSSFDHYEIDLVPGTFEQIVLPEFAWPTGAGAAADIKWYAAMTDSGITELFGTLGTYTFGWGL